PVGESNSHPNYADFGLHSQIPEPDLRSQAGGRVGDLAVVQERAQFEADECVVIDLLVEFPVGEEIVTSQRGAAFASVASSDVRPQPEVVIALEAENEELVEGDFSEGFAHANLSLHFVVLAAGLRKPVDAERTLEPGEEMRWFGPDAAELGRNTGSYNESL